MTTRRLRAGLVLLALGAAACGSGDGDEAAADPIPAETSVTSGTSPSRSDSTTSSAATTSTLPAAPVGSPPGIAALTSGRGDDGSLEIGIWFSSSPFDAGDVRLIVGMDSDGSYPGLGDPIPYIDGWTEIAGDGVSVLDGGTVVADETTGDLNEWLSWSGPGRVVWVYFIQNVPVRAGTVWVALEIDGELVAAGVAGAPFGEGCSFHSAGVDPGQVPGDVSDFGVPCRYPLG